MFVALLVAVLRLDLLLHAACARRIAAPVALLQQDTHRKRLEEGKVEVPPADIEKDHDGFAWWPHEHTAMEESNESSSMDGPIRDGAGLARVLASSPTVSNASSSAQTSSRRAITFVTFYDPFFDTNLGTTSLWKDRHNLPHEWLVLKIREHGGLSASYAEAQRVARHSLIIFLHPDVILPEDWYHQFMLKLEALEALDPNWGVLGTAGVPETWAGPSPNFIASNIVDFVNHFNSGSENLQVQSLDEHLLVLRKGSPVFDENLPGFDLYGSDIVLSAKKAGMKSYLLPLLLFHKTVDVDGAPYQSDTWYSKIGDPSFRERVHKTQWYLSQKWCPSGLLPVYGCAFNVWCNMDRPYESTY